MKSNIEGSRPKTIRSSNLKLILDIYRNNPKMTVAELTGKLNLSRTTVMKLNERLLAEGLIISKGKGTSTDEGGKRPELFKFNRDFGVIFCYYVKYNSIILKVFNIALEIISEKAYPIEENEELSSVVDIISDSFNKNSSSFTGKGKILGISIALHAIVNADKGVVLTSTRFESWGTDIEFSRIISEKINQEIPVLIESWIRFKAYGKKRTIKDRKIKSYIVIDAGWHGLVSGIIYNGRLYRGKNFLSGEIGHIVVNPSAKEICHCGGSGCLEMMTDFKRLMKNASELKGRYPASLIFEQSQTPDIFDIFTASNRNDPLACRLIDEVTDWFAIGIASTCLVIDPEIVFFEGDYSRAGRYFEDRLRQKINNTSLLRLKKEINIVFNNSDEDAVLRGGGSFIIEDYFSNHLKFI